MKKLTVIQTLIASSGFFILVSFQNCSKIQAKDIAGASSNKAAGAGGSILNPTTPLTPNVTPNGSNASSGSGTSGGRNPSSGGSTSGTMTCEKWDWKKHVDGCDDDDRDGDRESDRDDAKSDHGDGQQSLVADNDDRDDKDDNDSEHEGRKNSSHSTQCMPETAAAVAACNNGAQANVTGQDVVSNLRGANIIDAASMTSITDIRGSLIVRGMSSTQSHVATIQDVRGSLVICNLQADSIDNTRGNIILVNSTVKSLTHHQGAVYLYGSTITNSSDISGQVKQIH